MKRSTVYAPIYHPIWLACVFFLCLLHCEPGGSSPDAGPTDTPTSHDGREYVGDVAKEATPEPAPKSPDYKRYCETWRAQDPVDPATTDPCTPGTDTWRACKDKNGKSGYEKCSVLPSPEEPAPLRWGVCQPSCDASQIGTTEACSIDGHQGIRYCDKTINKTPNDGPVWGPCQLTLCQRCTPGQSKLCGPETNYPDSKQECVLSEGIPNWFDGNCWT